MSVYLISRPHGSLPESVPLKIKLYYVHYFNFFHYLSIEFSIDLSNHDDESNPYYRYEQKEARALGFL